MKETTLITALEWLIEKSEKIETMKDIREYIGLYNRVKEALLEYVSVNEKYKAIYDRLPEIEYREFKNPYYLFKTFMFEKIEWGYKNIEGPTLMELFPGSSPYPAKTKYLIEINRQSIEIANNISDILIQMLPR